MFYYGSISLSRGPSRGFVFQVPLGLFLHRWFYKPYGQIGSEPTESWLPSILYLLDVSGKALMLVLPRGLRDNRWIRRDLLRAALSLYQSGKGT